MMRRKQQQQKILYYCRPDVVTLGNPFDTMIHREEVLSLQPMFPPKPLDTLPLEVRILRRFRCVQIFLNGAPRVWAEKKYFGHKILMKQPHDCSY